MRKSFGSLNISSISFKSVSYGSESAYSSLIKSNNIFKQSTHFSTLNSNPDSLLLVYKGQFEARIKSLRRVSLFTSIVSVAGLPISIYLQIGQTIPMAGEYY